MTLLSLTIPWDLRRRGLADSIRHDKRIKEAMKQNLRELIAEEAIIASDGKRHVKIPIRYLDQYRFRYDFGHKGQGVGHGKGKPGDVIAREGQGQPGAGQAGTEPGAPVYEAEVSVDDLTQMMLEEFALPWLEEKEKQEVETTSYRFDDVRKTGSLANLDKRKTLMQNLRRNAARGNAHVGSFQRDDLRFRTWNERVQRHSNCAVYLLMDRSGSMTTEKKYITKTFFFWMVRFLRLKYEHVETVFIAHDTEAAVVPEKDFFTISNSGGTKCSSAYHVALEHIQANHPPSNWNNYVFHFSDGDNYGDDNRRCKELIAKLLEVCNMVGYGEVSDDFYSRDGRPLYNTHWSTLHRELSEVKHPHFVTVAISEKGDVYRGLQEFLRNRHGEGAAQQ